MRDRILRSIEPEPNTGCWFWMRTLNKFGYGLVSHNNKMRSAHRWVYESLVGPIPEGLHLDHLCRMRCCVNPDHLEPVTPKENTRRSPVHPAALKRKNTHCPNGHEYTEASTYSWKNKSRLCRICHATNERRYRADGRRKAKTCAA